MTSKTTFLFLIPIILILTFWITYNHIEIEQIKHELEIHYNSPVTHIIPEAHGESLNYTWACNSNECYKVFYILNDNIVDLLCMPNAIACHRIDTDGNHFIYYPNNPFTYTIPGCNIWTHEQLHAWGYNENMIWDFFECDKVSKYHKLPVL